MAKRGRPPLPPAQRKPPQDRKNISVEPELVTILNAKADALKAAFGFRPTLSQTIRHLIQREG